MGISSMVYQSIIFFLGVFFFSNAVFADSYVVSAHPLASQVGREVLKKGGTAVDASIAMAFVLGVVEPYSSGLGGGGFLLYYSAKTKKTVALDFRERAPFLASPQMYSRWGKRGRKLSQTGALAVATPGMVKGLHVFWKKYGSQKWAPLLEPSRQLAQKGFFPSKKLRRMFRAFRWKLSKFSDSRTIFVKNRWSKKDRWKQVYLAKTIQTIQKKGASGFYRGAVAKEIVRGIRKNRGILRLRDLQKYKTFWVTPVSLEYKKHRMVSMPSPSSGGVHLLQMFRLLSLFPVSKYPKYSSQRAELLVEIMRVAFRDRALFQGDTRFVKVPNARFLSKKYAVQLAKEIQKRLKSKKHVFQSKKGRFPKGHTSHLCVVDKDGNAVSMTLTINTSFGSGLVAGKTGVLMNNEMDDFTTFAGKPNHYGLVQSLSNQIQPLKTPLSSMTPTLVFHQNALKGVVGSPGGPTIISSVFQILQGLIDHGMEPHEAMRFPRIHQQWKPQEVWMEHPTASNQIVSFLKKKGYKIRFKRSWGNATLLWKNKDGKWQGVADPRGEGIAFPDPFE